mmetsp:Transcript_22647/g.36651  ORF Transcript_22647/g.36651 Transcript_22647/m.36651 type:complete len:284 (-) Transcript_22647:177-1028(-)
MPNDGHINNIKELCRDSLKTKWYCQVHKLFHFLVPISNLQHPFPARRIGFCILNFSNGHDSSICRVNCIKNTNGVSIQFTHHGARSIGTIIWRWWCRLKVFAREIVEGLFCGGVLCRHSNVQTTIFDLPFHPLSRCGTGSLRPGIQNGRRGICKPGSRRGNAGGDYRRIIAIMMVVSFLATNSIVLLPSQVFGIDRYRPSFVVVAFENGRVVLRSSATDCLFFIILFLLSTRASDKVSNAKPEGKAEVDDNTNDNDNHGETPSGISGIREILEFFFCYHLCVL